VRAVCFIKNSGSGFAVLKEDETGVDAIGVSAHGKEWAKWVDSLPFAQRRKISDVLWSLGENFSVDGPRTPKRPERVEVEAMLNGEKEEATVEA
jgi:hypothetical protein